MEISQGKLMRAIKDALGPYADAGDADEAAFHLSEIIWDIGPLQEILDAAKRGEPVRPELIEKAIGDVCVHWPYHVKGLRKRADRIRFEASKS